MQNEGALARGDRPRAKTSLVNRPEQIHACPNDCILYRKDFELLKSCLRCGLSHYKLKQKDDDTIEDIEKHGPPMKVMWYLPIIPRMKRLFTNLNDAKNPILHPDERKCDGMYHIQLILLSERNLMMSF